MASDKKNTVVGGRATDVRPTDVRQFAASMNMSGLDRKTGSETDVQRQYGLFELAKGDSNALQDKVRIVDDEVQIDTAERKQNIAKLLDMSTLTSARLMLNPEATFKRQVIFLDSLNQNNKLVGKYSWGVSLDKTFTKGYVNIIPNVQRIVALRMLAFNYIYIPDLLITNPDFCYNRWTVLIEELRAQSYICRSGFNYHFMCTPERGAAVDLYGTTRYRYDWYTVNFSDGYYWFNKPLTELSNITLAFGNPFDEFPMHTNVAYGTAGKSGGGNLTVTFTEPPYFYNENMYIKQFTTTTPGADAALIATINSTAYYVTFPPSTTLVYEFPVDVSAVTIPTGLIVQVEASQSFRMIFPLEIVYIDP